MVKVVYKHVDKRGSFIAFWREDGGEFKIFQSDFTSDGVKVFMVNEWTDSDEYRKYKEVNQNIFDDDINAAVYFMEKDNYFSTESPIDKNAVVKSSIEPGVYYPRIWRGSYVYSSSYDPIPPAEYGKNFTQSTVAADSLLEYLSEIFRYIEPSIENFSAYGHKIRELIILSCTEIESMWRAVLRENSTKYNESYRFTTNDYVLLKRPLRLNEWSLSMCDYPELGEFSPFSDWSKTNPTKSLWWYDAYNAVKHDREEEFRRATLENLINAMAALHILTIAQWGPRVYGVFQQGKSPFALRSIPSFVDEIYLPNFDCDERFHPVKYFNQ